MPQKTTGKTSQKGLHGKTNKQSLLVAIDKLLNKLSTKSAPTPGKRSTKQEANKQKKNKLSKKDAPDELVKRVEEYLAKWIGKSPNETFFHELAETMQAPDELMQFDYETVRDDFKRFINYTSLCDYEDLQPFGSSVSGLAFRGEFRKLLVHV